MLITIGIINQGSVKTFTMISLFKTVFDALRYDPTIHFDLTCPMSCNIPMNRNVCVTRALSLSADYLFFVDTDMKFPSATLHRLLDLDKDIVGATYNMRSWPPKPVLDEVTETKPFKANTIATGVLLIKTHVLMGIPKPWFATIAKENDIGFMGSDVYFSLKAKEHGFEVWCDPTIEVKHIGDFEY